MSIVHKQVIDLSYYYRTGGVSSGKTIASFDAAYIRAGQGTHGYKDPCYDEFFDQFAGVLPRGSYFLFDGNKTVNTQAAQWLAFTEGRRGEMLLAADFEQRYNHTSSQAQAFVEQVEQVFGMPALVYCNPAVIARWGYPRWLTERPIWLAWYLYDTDKYPDLEKYEYYAPFYAQRGGRVPPLGSAYNYLVDSIALWQFTDKADGLHYAANAKTADPANTQGIKAIDINATLGSLDALLVNPVATPPAPPAPPPSPPAPPVPPVPSVPDCCEELRNELAALTLRVVALESGTPPPPTGYPCDMIVATEGGDGYYLMLRSGIENGNIITRMPNGSRLTALGDPTPDSQGRGDWLWCEYDHLRGWAAGWLLSPAGSDHPALPAETMEVVVTDEKLRVEYIVGYDKACSGKTPPGKPVMQPDEKNPIRYNQGDKITVRSGGQVFSCKDTPKTATILTPGNIEYYRIADGQPGCNAQFSDLYPVGGYVNAEKVRVV
uniref:Putative glycoside hydrolase n=1 Tax=viral metagenome TaxID=1070528 RepID=A0A6M3L881_9ZZZZ